MATQPDMRCGAECSNTVAWRLHAAAGAKPINLQHHNALGGNNHEIHLFPGRVLYCSGLIIRTGGGLAELKFTRPAPVVAFLP
jgi:hypothetical protein